MNLKRLTALVLSLALALSLTAPGFAAENDETALPAETAIVSVDDADSLPAGEKIAGEGEPAPAADSEAAKEDESASAGGSDAASGDESASADDTGNAVGDESAPAADSSAPAGAETDPADGSEEETGPDEDTGANPEETLTVQTEAEEPALILWAVKDGADYAEQAEYEYDGKEHRPDYKLMREGSELPRDAAWTELWFADEACTQPAAEFKEPGKRYLRLLDGDTVKAQGSFTITKAAQRITVKTASVSQKYQKNKTFTLEAKSSGDGALKYKSSDDSVLSVNKKGVCTMHKPGVVTLTVKAAETEHYKAAKGVVEVTIYKRAKKLSYSRSYMSGKYYKALKKLKLTGTTGVNAADIALSQLGYKEGRKSGQMAGNGRGIGNWTEYGRYYGLNHQPWCAMFVNWCAREAGASYSAVPKYAACRYYHSYFKRQGRFHSWKKVRSGSYKPKKGDIILYAYSKGGVAHHIGYVLDVSYEDGKVKVTTVEGNTNDAVRVVSVSYSATGSGKHGSHYILGMANPKW